MSLFQNGILTRERKRTTPARFCSNANEPWKDLSGRERTQINEHNTRIHEIRVATRIHEIRVATRIHEQLER